MKQRQQSISFLQKLTRLSGMTSVVMSLLVLVTMPSLIAAPVDNAPGSIVTVNATQLRYTTLPSGNVSGALLGTQPIIKAVDTFNNVDTDYSGTITLTEASLGVLSGTQSQSILSGTASFTDLVYTATSDHEAFVLTASDGNFSDISSDSLDSDIVATQLVFTTDPSPTTLDANVTTVFTTVPVVQAVDANDLVDTDFSEIITLSENAAGTGVFTNNTVTAASGRATFTGLSLTHDRSETFQLVAKGQNTTGADLSSATSVNLAVGKTAQTITFAALSDRTFVSGATFSASASSDSGLTVTLTSTSTDICLISGNTVTMVSAGDCVITASQAGDSDYHAADDVVQTVTLTHYSLSIAKTSHGAENNEATPTDAIFTITVTPANTSGSAITGSIIYSGTATYGTDYATGTTRFSIAKGESTSVITLDVTEDTLVEGTETIIATMSNPSIGSITTESASANLIDDESYSISITNTTDGVENNNGTPTDAVFTVTVTPTNSSGEAITGDIIYTGTATEGTDYDTGETTFSIADGSSDTIITLSVKEDAEEEASETIIATLSNLSKGELDTETATANLIDDDSGGIDTDVDSIDNTIEDAAPNDGDGNGDGIKDSAQPHIASTIETDSNKYTTVVSQTNNCTLKDVASQTELIVDPSSDPEGYDYDGGLVQFTLECDRAEIEIFFHGLTEAPTQIRKYGKTPTSSGQRVWYDLAEAAGNSVTITPVTIDGEIVYKVNYTLVDGELGDDDLTVNGTIIDPVGAGHKAPLVNPVQGTVKPIPTLSQYMQYLLMGLLAIVGVQANRRKAKQSI